MTTTTDGDLTNTASVSSNETDPDTSDNSTSEDTTVNPVSDLSITVADSPDPVQANQDLTYTITVTNNGPSSASGVAVTDNLPGGVDFVSADAAQGSCHQASGTVTCNLGSLADQAAATVTIVVSPRELGEVVNTATVNGNEEDPNSGNNRDSAQTTVEEPSEEEAELLVTKTADLNPALVGHLLVYTLQVQNNGPDAATAATVIDLLPEGVDFVSTSSSQGACSESNGTVSCELGSLANLSAATIQISVTPRQEGLLANTATVTATETDSNTANNTSTVEVTVEYGPANLLFTQFANGEIEVAAAGSGDAQQVSVPNRTRIILLNNSDTADTGVIRFKDSEGNLTEVPIDGVSTHTVGYSLDPWSTTEVETDGSGVLLTGIIKVISERSEQSQIEGTEAFEILGSFVSVANSPPASEQQVYVSVTDEENTGVALLNPDPDNAVTIDATLVDDCNQQQAQKEVILQAGQQLVTFVNEDDLFSDFFATQQEDFRGRLKLAAQEEREFALLGLLQKQANGALIAVSTQSEGDAGRLIFTQFANGVLEAAAAASFEPQQEGIPNRTRLILINDGEQTVQFQGTSGVLSPVPIQGETTDTLAYSLDGGTATEVETDGTGELQTGVVEVNSDLGENSKIIGSEVFEILGNFVSVSSSPPRQSQQAYVSVTDDENTGVALYNPDSENALTLTLILVDSNGIEQMRKEVLLQPGQQLVQFVDQEELFAEFFGAQEDDFTGTLNIHAEEGKKAAVLGLLQIRATKALIAVSTSANAFGTLP